MSGTHTGRSETDALRRDLCRVAALEGTADPPTVGDYRAHGEWVVSTVRDRLGGDGHSWPAALDDAGLDGDAARERTCDHTPRDVLVTDIQRVAAREDTSDPPTQADYRDHGEWAGATVARRLGGDGHSWADALDDAGLDGDAARARATVDDTTEIPEGELLAALRALAAMPGTGDPPTTDDMTEVGRHSPHSYREEFGTWPDALDAAGLDGDAARRRGGGSDERIARADLLADVERVAARKDTGDPPTTVDYRTHGEYSYTTIRNRIGSWGDALDAAGVGGEESGD